MKKLTGIAWHSVWQRARAIIEVEGKEMYHNNRIQLEVQHWSGLIEWTGTAKHIYIAESSNNNEINAIT